MDSRVEGAMAAVYEEVKSTAKYVSSLSYPFLFSSFLSLPLLLSILFFTSVLFYPLLLFISSLLSCSLLFPLLYFSSFFFPLLFFSSLYLFSLFLYHSCREQLYARLTFFNIHLILFVCNLHLYFVLYCMLSCIYVSNEYLLSLLYF